MQGLDFWGGGRLFENYVILNLHVQIGIIMAITYSLVPIADGDFMEAYGLRYSHNHFQASETKGYIFEVWVTNSNIT